MLTGLRARAADVRGDDAGTSLAEIVVAMGITTVVGAIALSFFVWTGRATSNAAENSFTTGGARLAVSAMSSTLRLADSPTSQPGATDFRIIGPLSHSTVAFFANDDANRAGSAARTLPTRVVYTVTNGTVTEARYAPLAGAVAQPTTWTSNYPTTPTTTRILLAGVKSVVFDYDTYSTTTGLLTRVTDANLAGTTTALVASVTITVTSVATGVRAPQVFTATAVLTGTTS